MNDLSIPKHRTIAVVGGGLAGIAAAVNLAKNGVKPILLEKRPFLGGRAFSFVDDVSGEHVDNGQHVVVGACTQYLELLSTIGVADKLTIQKGLSIPLALNGSISNLKAVHLPGNLANLGALTRYKHMSLLGKIRTLYGLLAMRFTGDSSEEASSETFKQWLKKRGQTEETIRLFWDLLTLAALNDHVEDASAQAGIMLFQTAVLGPPSNAAIGFSKVGLSELVQDAACNFICDRGGEVLTDVKVKKVNLSGSLPYLETTRGNNVYASCIISAVPAWCLTDILPEKLAVSDFFKRVSTLEAGPIVAVHIWYSRPITSLPFMASLSGEGQWIFNVDALHGKEDGRHILISISGAQKWKEASKAEISDFFVKELQKLFPESSGSEVIRTLVIKTPQATFRWIPGSNQGRLPQKTPVEGLFLAGDWTSTGWPATMEGAARSGNLAAEAALEWMQN